MKERTKLHSRFVFIVQYSTGCERKSKHVWWQRSVLHFRKCPVRILDGTLVTMTRVFRSSTQARAVKYSAYSQVFSKPTINLYWMSSVYCQFFTECHPIINTHKKSHKTFKILCHVPTSVLGDELSYRKSIQTLTSTSSTSLDYIFLIRANTEMRSISGAEPQHCIT
jgi:hypothetical protein